jgi:hypothetical protein
MYDRSLLDSDSKTILKATLILGEFKEDMSLPFSITISPIIRV